MTAALLSGWMAMLVFVLAAWAAVSANRTPPGKLATGSYAGVDMDTFVSAWTRKFWLRRQDDRVASPDKPE